MNQEIVPFCKWRLDQGMNGEYKVVVAEREMETIGMLRIDVMGSEPDLRIFVRQWCEGCVVRNTTTGLVPITERDNKLLGFSCVIKSDYRRIRGCDLDDYADVVAEDDNFEVPEDNWYGIGRAEMDELHRIVLGMGAGGAREAVGEVKMTWDPDFEVVVRTVGNGVVLLSGSGKNVLDYWQTMCSICNANPDGDNEEATLPDFGRSHFFFARLPA